MLKMESLSGKGNFRLIRDDVRVLDVLYSEHWFSKNAETVVNGQKIEIKSKGLWQNKFNIFKNSKPCGEIVVRWDGKIYITLNRSDGKGRDVFSLKRKGWFMQSHELLSDRREKLLAFDTKFNWKTFRFNFNVRELDHNYPDKAIDELLVYSGFAVNLSLMNSGAA